MPWKKCKPMDERLRFIARLLQGGKMAPLSREFGISRVMGYKIYERYKNCGLDVLNDRSRAPNRKEWSRTELFDRRTRWTKEKA